MSLLAIFFAAAVDPAAAPSSIAPPHVYLRPTTDRCDSRASSDEVVICGNKDADERYRLREDDDPAYRETPARAAIGVGGGILSLSADPRKVDDAQDDVYFKRYQSQLRVRFVIPF